jgi:hypothetical protein
VKALTAAARGEHKAPPLNYEEYYAKLGLDPTVEHEPSVVNRAFRTVVAQAPLGRDGKPAGVSHAELFLLCDGFSKPLCFSIVQGVTGSFQSHHGAPQRLGGSADVQSCAL